MAANSKSSAIASLGKRVVTQIWTGHSRRLVQLPAASALTFTRRALHAEQLSEVYEKNPEDLVQPSVVPDDVLEPKTEEYWAPNPKTGVFGPATDDKQAILESLPANNGGKSVLEEKAFFRPTGLEDLEKPLEL